MSKYTDDPIDQFQSPPTSSSLFNKLVVLALVAFFPSFVNAAIRIDYPSERAVYQRDVTGYSTIIVAGTYSSPVDKIEVRAVPVYPGQGIGTEWASLANVPSGGVFSGELKLIGGWYTVQVRGMLGGVEVEQAAVNRMGVGEVFIIAGQSNAQGLRSLPYGPPAKDERVNYINNNQNTQNSLADPNPPTFAHLNTSDAFLSPMGQGSWCWGTLGDKLVEQLNVPVLFINASWEGTSIKNWAQSSRNEPTFNAYGGFQYPPSMPYGNLSISVRHYANTLGVRSILWMQGETDTYPLHTSRSEYATHLQFLLNKLASDVGKRIIWTIARTSRTSPDYTPGSSFTSQSVIDAQNDVLGTAFNGVTRGPETDQLGNPRADGVHFSNRESLMTLAQAWFSVMDVNYFQNITPLTPARIPAITAKCAANNTSATLELPEGYTSYKWSNGATSRNITITSGGTYFATLKNAQGMTVTTSPVRVESVKPATPSILPTDNATACAATGFQFSTNGTNDYTWMLGTEEVGKGSKFKAEKSGSYTLKAKNPIGCVSDISETRKLTILPEVAKPVIGYAGPFSIIANMEGDPVKATYKWTKDAKPLASATQNIYKVSAQETGESAVYTVQALAQFSIGGSKTLTCPSEVSEPFTYVMKAEEDIVIFPNPATGQLIYIESREPVKNVTITVFDMLGKNVGQKTFAELKRREPVRFPLSSGMYIIKVTSEQQELIKRIVMK